MKSFAFTAEFRPTYQITARVEPFNEDVVDPVGFLDLEGGAGHILLEGGSRIYLEESVIGLTADITTLSADSVTLTADQTFVVRTS